LRLHWWRQAHFAVPPRAAEPEVALLALAVALQVQVAAPAFAAQVQAVVQAWSAQARSAAVVQALTAAQPALQAQVRWSPVRTVIPATSGSRAVNRFSSSVPPVKHGKSGDNPPALHEQRAGKNAVLWLER
jgi:hypothetical protein